MTTRFQVPTESQEQKALVKWLSLHPTLKNFYCKNNNEGKRTEVQGYNLKLLGLRAGVSDLFISWPTNTFHGLWLEVKRNKKYTPSEMRTNTWIAQEKFLKDMQSVGYAGYFCYGWEDGKRVIEDYLYS